MCGRYGLHHSPAEVIRRFRVERTPDPLQPELFQRYNVAPTQEMPVIHAAEDGARCLDVMRWGLVPPWATDPSIGSRMINARAESAAEKPAFRHAFRMRRCVVPASGFYEWTASDGGRQPMWIHRPDDGLLALAGLWEEWHGPDGPLRTYCILTTDANERLAPIHARMPVILDDRDVEVWLDPRAGPEALRTRLRPCPPEWLEAYPVSRRVNRPDAEGPECIRPLV